MSSHFISLTSFLLYNHVHIKSKTIHRNRIPSILNLCHLDRHRLHIHKLLRRDFHTVIPNSHICRSTHKVMTLTNMQIAKLHSSYSRRDGEFARILSSWLTSHSNVIHCSYTEAIISCINSPFFQTIREQLRGLANIPLTIIE